jgi:hypothetical protein
MDPFLRTVRCSVQKLETEPTRYIPDLIASHLWTRHRPRRTRLASREQNVAMSRSVDEVLAVRADVARAGGALRSDRPDSRPSERSGGRVGEVTPVNLPVSGTHSSTRLE